MQSREKDCELLQHSVTWIFENRVVAQLIFKGFFKSSTLFAKLKTQEIKKDEMSLKANVQ